MAEGGRESRGGNEDTVGIKALSVLYPFLLILSIAACGIERVKAFIPSFFFFFFFWVKFSLSVQGFLSQFVAYGTLDSQLYILSAFLPPASPSSHSVWPSRFVSGHLLQRAQGDTWLLRHRWVAVSPGLLTTASWPLHFFSPLQPRWSPRAAGTTPAPPQSLLLFQCDANLWFCCEGHRSGSLTHFQLTDTIIHCLYWECWVCVCVCVCSRNSAC